MSFDKVEKYYNQFDEWNRLDSPAGRLEYEITLEVILNHLKPGMKVLDLGGGPGRYTIELAKKGYVMSLADLSPGLIEAAKEKSKGIENIESIKIVNAINLHEYKTEYFDAVLYLGPMYHLINDEDVTRSLKEVYRVLRRDGIIIAAFIPLLSGTAGVIERSLSAAEQVEEDTLEKTLKDGTFINKTSSGFQDGRYFSSTQVEVLMNEVKFSKLVLRSIRGLGFRIEKGILEKRTENISMYNKIMEIVNRTAYDVSVVNTCGHALYVGKKTC